MPGYFITFEGGEGAGKTTQINRLANALTEQGYKVITTREPGGTPESEKIRELLVQRDGGDWDAVSECLLLFAARRMHVEEIIRPALENNKIVISDRFTDSTRAYQGYGRGLDLSFIESLNDLVLDGLNPDRTFILDIDPEKGLERSEHRLATETIEGKRTEDRFETMSFEFHKKLRQGFLEIVDNNPDRCHLLDASNSKEELQETIFRIVSEDLSGV